MEDQIIDNTFDDDLRFNAQIKAYLRETAGWAKFLAIMGFVMVGIMVIFALFAGTIFSAMDAFPGAEELGGSFGIMITVIYLILAVIMFFPFLYLFRFATKAKIALAYGSEEEMTIAMENLKSHYKFIGIYTAIMLGLYAFALVFGVIGGLMFG